MDVGTFWNDKFAQDFYRYGEAPNAFLAAHHAAFPSGGRVLSLGEGEGRNAVFLAEQGYAVTAMDASSEGVRKTGRLAEARGVTVDARLTDLLKEDLGLAAWDGIVNVYCHLRSADRQAIYPRIQAALKPGGVFLTEQFSVEQLAYGSGGPKDPDMLLTIAELEAAFAGYELAYAAQELTELEEGPGHRGPGSVVRLIAIKPR